MFPPLEKRPLGAHVLCVLASHIPLWLSGYMFQGCPQCGSFYCGGLSIVGSVVGVACSPVHWLPGPCLL